MKALGGILISEQEESWISRVISCSIGCFAIGAFIAFALSLPECTPDCEKQIDAFCEEKGFPSARWDTSGAEGAVVCSTEEVFAVQETGISSIYPIDSKEFLRKMGYLAVLSMIVTAFVISFIDFVGKKALPVASFIEKKNRERKYERR